MSLGTNESSKESFMDFIKTSFFIFIFLLSGMQRVWAMNGSPDEDESQQESSTTPSKVSPNLLEAIEQKNIPSSFPAEGLQSGAIMNADFNFSYEESTYNSKYWRNSHAYGPPDFPNISDNDWLAFNTVRIETEKVAFKEVAPPSGVLRTEEDFQEVGTGFFVWSNYELRDPIPAIIDYYEERKEPLLLTCQHCVQEWIGTEEIKSYTLKFHYVNPENKKFYLLTINLPNTHFKVPWIFGESDMAALRLGPIFQAGKIYLDSQLRSSHYPLFKAINKGDCSKGRRPIGYLSDVIMFGYPYELSASNSMPLARFGHCSTDPKHSIRRQLYGGAPDFYIDMASISGSSGSPVWFYFREFTGRLSNTDVTVEADLERDEIEQDGEDLRIASTNIDVSEARLDDDDVDIEEKITCVFAGMFFGGPEKESDMVHDVHLGHVYNRRSIWSFLRTIAQQEPQ